MDISLVSPNILIKVLLTCGIVAAFLLGGTDIIAGLLKQGYRIGYQSASVLSASGTATRPYVLSFNLVAFILLIAFSIGIWFSAGNNWALRVVAVLLAGNAICSIIANAFFPIHLDESINAFSNKMNTLIMALGLFLILLAIAFGAVANHNWFRYFSIGVLLLFGLLTIIGLFVVPKFAHGPYTPPVGTQERTIIYSELLWLVLQAINLLRV